MQRTFISGANFSGRSAALRTRLTGRGGFFLGPYAEAALSGLSSTVADEIDIYREPASARKRAFATIDWAACSRRKPATLSGGEQVLLALHCFSLSAFATIAIDTALEQLDAQHRISAFTYLDDGETFDVLLIDNRAEHVPADWDRHETVAQANDYACDLAGLTGDLRTREAPVIAIQGMDFSYPGRPIFRGVDLALMPGRAYRLTGRNGAGKTTFFKLLVGVLAPSCGAMLLDGAAYAPRRIGNRAFALATQNPDHQWCGTTLAEDIARRRKALAGHRGFRPPSDDLVASLAARLGIRAPHQPLCDLPLAARKRLSWLWPFSGAMPWLMLDEPTVGQDHATRTALADVISRLCILGHGVMFVTHDDEFAASLPHQPLRIEDMTIRPA
jgi:iron complex transport system ATP-binding protein